MAMQEFFLSNRNIDGQSKHTICTDDGARGGAFSVHDEKTDSMDMHFEERGTCVCFPPKIFESEFIVLARPCLQTFFFHQKKQVKPCRGLSLRVAKRSR